MTRLEAIQILERRMTYSNYGARLNEALDIAIESLKTIDNCDQCEWCCPSDGTPTIHVVRCKDCIHYESDGGALMVCRINDMVVDETDYCSYGERREQCD